MSTYRIGDPIYDARGMPGVVTKFDPLTGKLEADREPELVKKSARHGFIAGLSETNRQAFNEFMDQVAGITDPKAKMSKIRDEITRLEGIVEPSARHLASYLKAELNHVMSVYNIHPRYYEAQAQNIRGL